jgi:hypothetical protein
MPPSRDPFDVLAVRAHVLGVAAGYAYSDGETVTEMMTLLGLERCRCLTVSFRNDTMFIAATAHVVQSEDGRVVVIAFRGTEPVNLAGHPNMSATITVHPSSSAPTATLRIRLVSPWAGAPPAPCNCPCQPTP